MNRAAGLWEAFARCARLGELTRCDAALRVLAREGAPAAALAFGAWLLDVRRGGPNVVRPPPADGLPPPLVPLALSTLFDVGMRARAARLAVEVGDVRWIGSLLVHDPEWRAEVEKSRGDLLSMARALSDARHGDAAPAWRALAAADPAPARLSEAIAALFQAGDNDGAHAALAVLGERFGSAPEAQAWRVRLALWDDRAGEAPVASLPDGPEGDLLRGAVWVKRGDLDRGLGFLRRAQEADPSNPEVATWLAQRARLAGAPYADLAQDAQRLGHASIAARLLNLRVQGPAIDTLRRELGTQFEAHRLAGDDGPAALDALLRSLAGNLSGSWTEPGPQGFVARALPFDPRERGRRVQKLLESRPISAVERQFDLRAGDRDPLYLIYWGETRLWLGEYDSAEAFFREALAREPATLWARIGLGAALSATGRAAEALDVWAELSFQGPTVFVYRGEALQRLRRFEEAEGQLTWAIREKPTRLGAWLVWARQDLTLADALAAHLRDQCPHWPEVRTGASKDVIAGALTSLAGNRSSATTCVRRGDEVQFLDWKPEVWARSEVGSHHLAVTRGRTQPPPPR